MSGEISTGALAGPGRIRPGRAFRHLYGKDLQAHQFTLVLFAVLIGAWEVFLLTRVRAWPTGVPLAVSMAPLGFIPLWTAWDAVQSYRAEWQSGSCYFLLSAPLPGWLPAASKLAAVMTGFTVHILVTLGGTLSIAASPGGLPADLGSVLRQLPAGTLARWAAAAAIGMWLWGLAGVVVFQAAAAASQLAYRWRFPALVGAVVVAWWLVWRMGGLGHFLFGWVPDVPLPAVTVGPEGVRTIPAAWVVDSGPLAGMLLAVILLFAVTAWLVEHGLEVA